VASEVIFPEFVVTRILHTARISNVESTVCINKERKMVNFRNEKDGRCLCIVIKRPCIEQKISGVYVLVTFIRSKVFYKEALYRAENSWCLCFIL